jgi:hypothetical protein
MNKTKTFKIGESCVGGIIQIKVSEGTYFPQGTTIKVLVKEWNGGAVIHSNIFGRIHESRLVNHLHDMTTSYHAETIMEWIKENAWQHSVLVTMEGRN